MFPSSRSGRNAGKMPSGRAFFLLISLAWLMGSRAGYAQDFYDADTLQKIEIQFSQPDWDYRMDTAKAGSDGYLLADWVKINNVQFDSAGVKYKGNSSYDSTYAKNPIHIALDEFLPNSYEGFTDVKLSNGYADPSMIREVLAYGMVSHYMECPRANFAQLYINGQYVGLYTNVENVGKEFCSDHFYSSDRTFIKCNPVINPGPATKSNLKFIPAADSSGYFNFYELKSDIGWNDLVALCDSLTNIPSGAGLLFDMDRVLWMLALNNVLVNLDSYTGVFCQNYYLYRDAFGLYNPVMWDLNMSFGGFPFVGSLNSSMGSLTVTNMQQLSPLIHATDPYWPLINAVLADPVYKRMYIAHMRTITSEMFASGSYVTEAAQLQALVDTAVQSDSNSFFSYAQFQAALTANNNFGSYVVPGISTLMNTRASWLQSTTEFSQVPPAIAWVAGDTAPDLNDTVWITARVTNASPSAVYLGWRNNAAGKFVRVSMADDGLHGDSAAGDQIFGASLIVSAIDMQYYVYAENANAGIFSPERAEHEFYALQATVQNPQAGQLMINEFLALNQSGAVNETGQHEDWIELYNPGPLPISLYGMYLTDNASNLAKFAFPQNTEIAPDSVLIIWADDGTSTPSYVHANFKLSGNGEEIILSNANGDIVDSITFGPQVVDLSMGRCPDGTGSFSPQSPPSFNAKNCTTGMHGVEDAKNYFTAYPVPAHTRLEVTMKKQPGGDLEILNALGRMVWKGKAAASFFIDVSNWAPGVYFLRSGMAVQRIQVIHD